MSSRNDLLLAQLRTYEPADAAEAGHRAAMVELLGQAANPFARSHFRPGHFTASCYIVDGEGRLLLHHHKRLDRWLQMGGHVEGEETPEVAALREGREESGLDDLEALQLIDLDIHAIPAGKGEPDHDHFDVRYLARTSRPGAISIDRAESNDLAWVPLERAAELMPGLESLRVIRKLESLISKNAAPVPGAGGGAC
jgi:8-oxo-dGTP pyrophosphatase MutT (NUDIX family)